MLDVALYSSPQVLEIVFAAQSEVNSAVVSGERVKYPSLTSLTVHAQECSELMAIQHSYF